MIFSLLATIALVGAAPYSHVRSASAAAPQRGAVEMSPNGRTTFSARFGQTRILVLIVEHEVSIGSASDPPPAQRRSNCTFSHIPCSLVDLVEIEVDGRKIDLPRSAFGALADLDEARLAVATGGRYRLALTGGDASESYRAEILFDRHRALQRVIVDGESGQVAERTTYYAISWLN